MKPTIAVIIINYNYSRYLQAAVNSALNQTYKPTEIIVVDDGSTDNSLELLQNFDEIVVVSKENGGLTSAACCGIERVSSHLVIFLDADDRLLPNACATIAKEYSNGVIQYAYQLVKVDTTGNNLGYYPEGEFVEVKQREFVSCHGYFPSSPTSGNAYLVSHCVNMLSAVKIDHMRFGFDGYLSFSSPFFGRVKIIRSVLGEYLCHGSNMSANTKSQRASLHFVRNALCQCRGILIGMGYASWTEADEINYLSAYHLKHALMLKKVFGEGSILAGVNSLRVACISIRKFWTDPQILFSRRLTNTIFIVLCLIFPKSLISKMKYEQI